MRRIITVSSKNTETCQSVAALTTVESSETNSTSVSISNSKELLDNANSSKSNGNNAVSSLPSGHSKDNQDDYLEMPLYVAHTLLFRCLSVCGLYHVRRKDQSVSPVQVYCWVMTILPFVSLIVMLSALRLATSGINIDLIQLLNITFFNVLCCNNAVAFLANCHRPSAIRKLFLGLQKLDRFGGAYTSPARVEKTVKIVVGAACIFYLCGAALIVYSCVELTVIDTFVRGIGFSPTNVVVKWLVALFSCFIAVLWYVPNCAALCFSLTIFSEYRLFFKAFAKKIDKDSGAFCGSLETERKRFVAMSLIVEAADRLLALYHGVSFVTDTANLCLSLYCIAFFNGSNQAGAFVVWLILTAIDLSNKLLCGILVNFGSRQFKERLYRIDPEQMSQSTSTSLLTFLSHAGDNAGYSVAHLFVIDQTVILSMLGLFVTYFLILVQFATNSSSSSSTSNSTLCNCTDVA